MDTVNIALSTEQAATLLHALNVYNRDDLDPGYNVDSIIAAVQAALTQAQGNGADQNESEDADKSEDE